MCWYYYIFYIIHRYDVRQPGEIFNDFLTSLVGLKKFLTMKSVIVSKCVRFGAGRSEVRLSAGSYQNLVYWYCSLLTKRALCWRAAGVMYNAKKQIKWYPTFQTLNIGATNHCGCKASSTHYLKKINKIDQFPPGRRLVVMRFVLYWSSTASITL